MLMRPKSCCGAQDMLLRACAWTGRGPGLLLLVVLRLWLDGVEWGLVPEGSGHAVALSCPSDCAVHVCNVRTRRLLHMLGVEKDLKVVVALPWALPK